MRTNVGCGEFYADWWKNVDLHDDVPGGPRPDVVASLLKLPFRAGSCTHVYLGHVLEHIPRSEVMAGLKEARRVLRRGGQLMVVGPDLDRAQHGWPEMVQPIVEGQERWDGDRHLWSSNATETLAMVRDVFAGAVEVPVGQVDEVWPLVSAVGWQYAIHATK